MVYDPVLYRIEFATGIHPRYFVEMLNACASRFEGFCIFVYANLPLMVIMAASSQMVHSKWSIRDNLFIQFTVSALLGYGLYYILPAVGPWIYFKGLFPGQMPNPLFVPAHPILFPDGGASPRNAMPSMHAAWAIMCFLALRRSPLWHRALGVFYVLVTFVTTIGFGFHYILDWVVALPLVCFIRGVTDVQPLVGFRITTIAISALLIAAWCVIIRTAPASLAYPALIQVVTVSSMMFPFFVELRLACTQDAVPLEEAIALRLQG